VRSLGRGIGGLACGLPGKIAVFYGVAYLAIIQIEAAQGALRNPGHCAAVVHSCHLVEIHCVLGLAIADAEVRLRLKVEGR